MPSSPECAHAADSDAIPINEIHILWITAGLSCDGDTIAMTAATQPSIEDILLGGIPWIPKVHLHNPLPMTTARNSCAISIRPRRASSRRSS